MSLQRIRTLSITLIIALALVIPAQAGKKGGGIVDVNDLRTYLTYLSSDDLEGRNTTGSSILIP